MKNKYIHTVTASCLISFCISFFSAAPVYAQDINAAIPFRGYYYDYKVANPAFAGFEDRLRITTVYQGVPFNADGQPSRYYLSGELKLDKLNSAIGGMLLLSPSSDYISQKGVALFYNYAFDLSEKSSLRIGTQLSYQRYRIDYSRLNLADGDPLLERDETNSNANMDIGVLYHSPVVTVGGTFKNLFRQKMYADSAAENYSSMNFIVTRKFRIRESLTLTPSIFFQTSDRFSEQIAFNVTANIQKWIIVGGGYLVYIGSSTTDLTINAGVNIKDYVQIMVQGYSSLEQDYREYTSGTRAEVMIRFRLADKPAAE